MNQIIPTAEPFFFPGAADKPGVLLIHGFTGTPQSLRPMGVYLNQEFGLTCLGIRLAGHATTLEDMARTRYTNWLASVEDGLDLLSGAAKRVYLAGFSTGGSLALALAPHVPVQGVISMAAPFDLGRDWRLRVAGLIALLRPYIPKPNAALGEGWYDKEAAQTYISYASHPVRSVVELGKLLTLMRSELPKIRLPVLLIHSRQDAYPIPESMPRLFELLGTAEKEMLWVDGSSHLITLDAQRQAVFEAAADFIARVESRTPPGSASDNGDRPLVTDYSSLP